MFKFFVNPEWTNMRDNFIDLGWDEFQNYITIMRCIHR